MFGALDADNFTETISYYVTDKKEKGTLGIIAFPASQYVQKLLHTSAYSF